MNQPNPSKRKPIVINQNEIDALSNNNQKGQTTFLNQEELATLPSDLGNISEAGNIQTQNELDSQAERISLAKILTH